MIDTKFIHLRVHSAYSLSEGTLRIKSLMPKLVEMNVPAIAITDTSNMFGAKEFSEMASKSGIQPILGCQFYIRNSDSDDPLKSKGRFIDPDKVVLLVKNAIGYRNIMHIMKKAYIDGPEGEKPQINYSDLEKYSDGLILLSGGVEGPVGRLLVERRFDEAEEILNKLNQYFEDNFYIEISRIGLESEKQTEEKFIELAYKYNIPLVATNEAFFDDVDMHEAHDALICIAGGEYVSNPDRKKYSPNNRLKTEAEMLALFEDLPEALENTVQIAKRCGYKLEFIDPILPPFNCGEGISEDESISEKATEGLKLRMDAHVYFDGMTDEEKTEIDKKYFERLEYELSVIKKMGFPGYFLIVADFIQWSKDNNIPVGPGRGSGAGSIVAWALKITDLDPLKFDLLFERFLNPERISMPDFDVDFCQDKRSYVIDYVQNKYGHDKVAQIVTYGKLQSKAVIRDVARVLQMPYSMADRISKMIPGGAGKNVSLKEALEQVEELEEMRATDPQINKLFDLSMRLEGLFRHSGVHACGVVIGDRPLENLVPVYKDPKAEMPVTQFDSKWVEHAGLIKFDFLGLKTLTVIQRAVQFIEKEHGVFVDVDHLDFTDKKTYELLQRGETAGVFQFESAGMRDIHKQLKPDRFEDLIAIVSLYRPGPMENIPSYIRRKHGDEEPTYLHEALEPILKETYGIMIYQEQVMKIARELAGYTMGGADKLRKAMGKKIAAAMIEHRKIFADGAVKNGIDRETAQAIFAQMEKFASYGFNKSHAAAYSLVSYQTAYLKAHYPVEFMTAIMSLDITNTDKLCSFKQECIKMGIEVKKPDINKSDVDFKVEDGAIRYALAAVKGVGEANMACIVKEREANGTFKSISDFIHRLDSKNINRRQIENLIKAGAFDSLETKRGMLFANTELMLQHASAATELKTSAQSSLFGDAELQSEVKLDNKPDWPELEKLKFEADAIGFYLSAHPMDSYAKGLEKLGVIRSIDLAGSVKTGDKARVKMAGTVNSFQKRVAKSGNKYAFLELSDAFGSFEGIIFAEALSRYEEVINSGQALLVSAIAEKQEEDSPPRMIFNVLEPLDKAISEIADGLMIYINNEAAIAPLKQILARDSRGRNRIVIIPEDDEWDIEISLKDGFALSGNILTDIRKIAGVTSVKEI
jgi:DNA polymerase-3 subunit alpha